MTIHHIAAFSTPMGGGNPAGVMLAASLPDAAHMQSIARDLGYSETVFAAPNGPRWTTRYFSPVAEVAFCGHATIALGAVLGRLHGAGRYDLDLSQGPISAMAAHGPDGWTATLQSPPTHSAPLRPDLRDELLALFNLTPYELDERLPPTLAFAGVQHAILALKSRETLAVMAYPFGMMRDLMAHEGLTTVSLLYIDPDQSTFYARNAFAIGGVVEDPATGAAAAALGGALVDLGWPDLAGGGTFHILQGADMGHPSHLTVTVTGRPGDPVAVSGAVREIAPPG